MQLRVPPPLVERMERKVPVSYLARRAGVRLTKVGEDLVGHCLLHEAAGLASLHVTPAVNLWRCERCRAGGGVIAWVRHHANLSRQGAALELLFEFFPGEAMALGLRAGRSLRPRRVPRAAAHAGKEASGCT